jgi:hypothetical protein
VIVLYTKIKNAGEFTPETFEEMISMGNRQIIMEALETVCPGLLNDLLLSLSNTQKGSILAAYKREIRKESVKLILEAIKD